MKDLKYLAAMTLPLSVVIGVYFKRYWSFTTPFYAFVMIPILEILLPQDQTNYEGAALEKRKKNSLFDWMLYLNVPIVFSLLIYILWDITTNTHSVMEMVGLCFYIGIVLGINVAHELGHRQKTNERYLAKLLLLPAFYMHFYIEHNFGHHHNAAIKEDPATARFNQTVYSFWLTSVVHQYFSAWKLQMKLLRSEHKNFISLKNDMLWYSLF